MRTLQPVSPARHQAYARTAPWRLMLSLAARMRWRHLLRVPSNMAWMVLRRKYDAFTTDRAYEDRPASWLGPFGRWADRRVLDYPMHVALRDRLALVTGGLVEAVSTGLAARQTVRVLSAPAGLGRDVIGAVTTLRATGAPVERVELHCLDLDQSGDVLPELARRLRAAEVAATLHREDLLAGVPLLDGEAGADVINCIGLTAWLTLDECQQLFDFFRREVAAPGGRLLVDNWAEHEHSWMGQDLEISTYYHPPADFIRALEGAGWSVEAVRPTANGVCALHVAHAR